MMEIIILGVLFLIEVSALVYFLIQLRNLSR